jgi:hypothetical protein
MHAYGMSPGLRQGLPAHFEAAFRDDFDQVHVVRRLPRALVHLFSRAVRRTPKEQRPFDEKSSRFMRHVQSLALPILSIAP